MEDLKLSNVPPNIQTIIEPFLLDVLTNYKENIISIYIIGSTVTKDFHAKYSDINTLIVVKENKIPFFDFIATLGKRYGKKKIRAPLIMTSDYINRSLEVFPLEFLEMKLINKLVYGDDVLKDVKIEKADIRLQCERELKGKLQHLCQGYIKSMGDNKTLTDLFVGSLSGYFPLFRGILFLYGHEIPTVKGDVLYALNECCDVDINVFKTLMDVRAHNFYPQFVALKEVFKDLYSVLNAITKKVDEFKV